VLNDHFDHFKITLFTIPQKADDNLLYTMDEKEYAQLAMHGWEHNDSMEAYKWHSLRMIRDRFKYWKRKTKKFNCVVEGWKAPGWWNTPEVIQIVNEYGWWAATNVNNPTFHDARPNREYVFDLGIHEMEDALDTWKEEGCGYEDYPLKIHGHTHNCGNGIEECMSNVLKIPKDAEFYWIDEAVDIWY